MHAKALGTVLMAACAITLIGCTAARTAPQGSGDVEGPLSARSSVHEQPIGDGTVTVPVDEDLGIVWKYQSNTGEIELLCVSKGCAYVHDGKNLVGLNSGTGAPVHTIAAAGADQVWPIADSVLIRDGYLLRSIDSASGAAKWTHRLAGDPADSRILAVVESDGLVLAEEISVSLIDARTGEMLWDLLTPDRVRSAAHYAGKIYLVDSGGALTTVSVRDGQVIGRSPAAEEGGYGRVWAADGVLLETRDGKSLMYYCHPESDTSVDAPELLWLLKSREIRNVAGSSGVIAILSSEEADDGWFWASWEDQSIHDVDTGFLGEDIPHSSLTALDSRSGSTLFTIGLTADAVMSEAGVFFLSGDGGTLYAIDPQKIADGATDDEIPINRGYAAAGPTGLLSIESRPAGAHIAIDGRYSGRGPMDSKAISVGQHEIRAYLPGHAVYAIPVIVSEGRRSAIQMELLQSLRCRWSFSPANERTLDCVTGANLVVVRTEKALHALSPDDGDQLWTLDLPNITHVASDGRILSYAAYREMGAVRLHTGASIWRTTLDGELTWLALHGALLLTACGNGTLAARDTSNGEIKWRATDNGRVADPVVAGPALAYLNAAETHIQAVDIVSGDHLWRTRTDANVNRMLWRNPFLVAASEEHMCAYDPGTGAFVGTEIRLDGPPVFDDEAIIYRRSWAIEPGHVMHITSIVRHRDPFFQPSIIRIAHVSDGDIDTTFDGKRLFVSQGSNVAAYDCASGTERWTRQTDCFARMCCYEDMILAYGGGTLQCVDPDSGMTVITNEFADPISAVVVGGVGNRFFVFEGGRVHAYGYSVPR